MEVIQKKDPSTVWDGRQHHGRTFPPSFTISAGGYRHRRPIAMRRMVLGLADRPRACDSRRIAAGAPGLSWAWPAAGLSVIGGNGLVHPPSTYLEGVYT